MFLISISFCPNAKKFALRAIRKKSVGCGLLVFLSYVLKNESCKITRSFFSSEPYTQRLCMCNCAYFLFITKLSKLGKMFKKQRESGIFFLCNAWYSVQPGLIRWDEMNQRKWHIHVVVHRAVCRTLYNKESWSPVANLILKPSQSPPLKTDCTVVNTCGREKPDLSAERTLVHRLQNSPRKRVFVFFSS